jgi:hypothetical protein
MEATVVLYLFSKTHSCPNAGIPRFFLEKRKQIFEVLLRRGNS